MTATLPARSKSSLTLFACAVSCTNLPLLSIFLEKSLGLDLTPNLGSSNRVCNYHMLATTVKVHVRILPSRVP
jgi:hypothetical protein